MADNVYNGFWINWDDGKIRGSTLTLPTYEGLLLVSFLTLFVQFSGGCFWRVLCFIIHQVRSTTANRDGLFHQQQALLRNATTAPSGLWGFIRAAWAWRNHANGAIPRSLGLILITTVHLATFGIAGLFSSQVTTTTAGEALVRSTTCGWPKEVANPAILNANNIDAEELKIFNSEVLFARMTITKSASYVRTCYKEQGTSSSSSSSQCGLYVQQVLSGPNSSAVYNATCPFGSEACSTEAARFDSGIIRSNSDLGMNAPDEDSLTMRRVTTCAPIRAQEKYATDWRKIPDSTHYGYNNSARYFEMGPSLTACQVTDTITNLTTFCVTSFEKQFDVNSYSAVSVTAYQNNASTSDFSPIPDFTPNASDTTLLSVLNRVSYVGQVTDPIFLAENATSDSNYYTATQDLAVLGCSEQYQFCNGASGDDESGPCTPLTGLYGLDAATISTLNLNPRQRATYAVMWKAAWSMAFQFTFNILGNALLLAQDYKWTTEGHSSSALPSNQWQIESYNLHNISLAVFQRRINEFSNPETFAIRPGLDSLSMIDVPTDPELLHLCQNQKIRSLDHYSVSVLGMAVILVIGTLLILLDMFLVREIFWWRGVAHTRLSKKMDWIQSGTLQLQRQALEARGVGPWKGVGGDMPVLEDRGRTFAVMRRQTGEEGLDGLGDGRVGSGTGYQVVPSQVPKMDEKA